MTSVATPPANASRLGWTLVVLAWLAVCWARPWFLGFYDDDWVVILLPAHHTLAWSWDRLAYYLQLYANRPVTGLLSFVLSSVCGESAPAWHTAICGLLLAAALSLRLFLRRLSSLVCPLSPWAPDLAAALWVVFPFTLGLVARPTQGPCVACIACFALSGAVLFDRWQRGRPAGWAPVALYLLGILAYESLYGGFLVLLLFACLAGIPRRIGWRSFAKTTAAFAVVQLAAIVWNRAVPLFDLTAPSKSYCPAWAAKLADNVIRLRSFIGHSARELSPAVEGLLLALLVGAGVLVLLQLRRATDRRVAARTLAAWGACGVGLAIGLVVVSLAGFSLMGIGLDSRMATSTSVWLAVAVAIALASIPARPAWLRHTTVTATLLLIAMFAYATNLRLRDWSGAWQVQKQVLAGAPVNDLQHAQAGAVVLFFGPEMYNGVRTFGHIGNLDYAMRYAHPDCQRLIFTCAARDNWITRWDGRHFEQRHAKPAPWDRHKVWNALDAPEVWVWVRGTGRARRIATPFEYRGTTDNATAAEPLFKVDLPFVFSDELNDDAAAPAVEVAVEDHRP